MAFIKKEWKNRLVEFAGRRKLTRVAGSIENEIVVDVTREEGTVSQQGDAFSEANMNDLEQRIEDGFNDTIDKNNILDKEEVEANTEAGKYVADALVVKEMNDNLQGFTPIIDPETGQITGYKTKVGADTVFPFSSSSIKGIITPTSIFKNNNIEGPVTNTFSIADFPNINMFGILQKYYVGMDASEFNWELATYNNGTSIFLRSGEFLVRGGGLSNFSISDDRVTITINPYNTNWRLFTIE